MLPKPRREAILLTLATLLPTALIVLFLFAVQQPPGRSKPEQPVAAKEQFAQSAADGRLVLVIADSLRRQAVDQLMPHVKALAQQPGSTYLDVHTAAGNLSLPCMQTLLEGRESPYASGIHDFSGRTGASSSLPAAAARAGLNPAIVGDFIVLGLYKQYVTTAVNWARFGPSDLGCDLASIGKAIDILSDQKVRLLILHFAGTDHVAHRRRPGHPEYERHYRAVDAKLAELIGHLDLSKDQLIVTGDHGHNEYGSHVPWSVAIFAGGIYPQLFAALGPIGQLQQVDMDSFLSFPQALPLPTDYEGRYFGIETPIQSGVATPELQRRLQRFRDVQAKALGVSPDKLQQAIRERRAQARSLQVDSFERTAPLLMLFFAWVLLAFHSNAAVPSRIWPLVAISIPAIAVWLNPSAAAGLVLALIIALVVVWWAIKTGALGHLFFVGVLVLGAALTAFQAERSEMYFRHYFVIGVLAAAIIIALSRKYRLLEWPAACCAVGMFVIPTGAFKTQLGVNIRNAWLLGLGCVAIALLFSGRFRRIHMTKRGAIMLCGLLISGGAWYFTQYADMGIGYNVLISLWRRPGAATAPSALLYLACAAYLVWVIPRPQAWAAIVMLLLPPFYSSWFGKLPLPTLAVALLIPVFFASWIGVFESDSALLRAESGVNAESSGLLVAAALLATFWMLFQGFFVEQIDFSFVLRHLPEGMSEGREFAIAFPLTLLKYGLPLIIVLLAYVGLHGSVRARQGVIAALIFCNLKLLCLLVQIFLGPLGTQQKFYELAMSDFVFVSQATIITAAAYLVMLSLPDAVSHAAPRIATST